MRIVAGRYKNRRIELPKDPAFQAIRPTSDFARQAIFNLLTSRTTLEGAQVLDLCAGSGALGLEALSRGASSVLFVDQSTAALAHIEGHLARFGAEGGQTLHTDVRRLPPTATPVDLLFFDPPYRCGWLTEVLASLQPLGYIHPNSWIVIEYEHGESISLPPTIARQEQRRYGRAVIELLRSV